MSYAMFLRLVAIRALQVFVLWQVMPATSYSEGILQVGAAAVKVSPTQFPVHNAAGGFVDRESHALLDDLYSRCIVIDDGQERIAIVVVDVTKILREFADEVKESVAAKTGIQTDHILIAATHTHSAPNTADMSGVIADRNFLNMLAERIPVGVERAIRNLRPARVGWTVVKDPEHTHTRRWIRRPDKVDEDPLGARTVRANMHPGFQNPDVIGPSGPSDPDISIVAFQTLDGRPIAVLANYANHYYGVPLLADGSTATSADYFGKFAQRLASLVTTDRVSQPSVGLQSGVYKIDLTGETSDTQGRAHGNNSTPDEAPPAFVAMMTQGTSGDQQWMDYSRAPYDIGLDAYADAIADEVFNGYRQIVYRNWVPVKMEQMMLTIGTRQPSAEELRQARDVVTAIHGRAPRTITESYAMAVVQAATLGKTTELKLQAIAIGELGITAIPNEVYAITGLKIKAQSPLSTTINMELANGGNGYLPTPEQYLLGGYTTWRWPRFLEPEAEPKIVNAVLGLLERVAKRPRHKPVDPLSDYDQSVLAAKPAAYWRLNEFNGPTAYDETGKGHDASYEGKIAFYLSGPVSAAFARPGYVNRAPQLVGGRIERRLALPRPHYTVELWFWNGLANDLRFTTGWLLSTPSLDRVGIGGTAASPGRLILTRNKDILGTGKTVLVPQTWYYLALVRDETAVKVYLNGHEIPEITVSPDKFSGSSGESFSFGSGLEAIDSFEGRIDNVAIYDRSLTKVEISDHYRLAGMSIGLNGP